jgi:hypothetical protein
MAFCSSAPLWLGQSIAVHHRGKKIQRVSDSSSLMPNSEEPLFCWRRPCVFSHQDSSDGTALQDYSLCSSLMMTLGTRSITLQWPHLWHSPREVPAPEGFLSFSCQRHSSDILYLKR